MQGQNHGKFRGKICGQCHFTSSPCSQTVRTTNTHFFVSTPLQDVKQFDYLGLSLDPMLTMKPAVASIQEKANKGNSLALAVSYSLWYDKHHSNPTLCRFPVEMLNLWKSCVLPQFLLYLRYISDASQVQTLQASLNRSLSTTLHVSMATPPRYLLRQVFPPFTLPRTCNLPNSNLDCTPLPMPLFNIFSGNSGSHCCKLCPCTPSKPACRLQYVTWTWHSTVTLLPLCLKT